MWHVWVKAFRRRNDLTQEAAAHMLGVDVRTIRRWEAGSYPSSTHVKQFESILMPSPDHRLAASIKPLLDITGDMMIAFDQDWRVLGQSRAHKAHMRKLWGEEDVRGVLWTESKYCPENLRVRINENGGGRGLFKKGFVSTRTPFLHEQSGQIINAGRNDTTYLRLADGPVILVINHLNMEKEFIENYVKPWIGNSNIMPDSITTLDH